LHLDVPTSLRFNAWQGAGESGKSTLFKQMRILYGKGFDDAERVKYLPKIGFNMMEGLQVGRAGAH
jgi:hypothetical protein